MKIHFLISIVVLMSSFSSWASRDRANDSKELMRASDKIPYVLMISIDGYRYDYTERFHPPHLSRLAQEGVRAKSLQSVFPSKTFPNHYSLVTGLYAGGHGIVENRFYDTAFGATYALGDPITNESRWYGGDPLWNVVQAYGIKSACYFWVGSDVEINGQRPTYYKPYDGSVENRERIKQILNWLSLPEKDRPHFLTLYFSAVDSQGHQHGPKDPVKEPPHPLKESVLEIDKVLGELFDGLQKTGLDINVIVVSDHGMKDIDEYKYLGDKGIDYSDFKVVGSGP
ncbi:MAG: alkaline phosphatase family protein, partial [Bdellovibrionales bacterium]|nr:alkaline phosphatase family protein [Bdellovibrionales bacterium]